VNSKRIKPRERRSQKLKLVSEYPPEQRKEILETLVVVDKLGRRRHVRRESDVKVFIATFFRKETAQ